jgi:CubicO group peptidase (beta-lactamase class C family)
MRPIQLLVLIAALLAITTPQPLAVEFDRGAVSAFIAEAFQGDRVPGGAVAIIQSGELVFLEGFGVDAQGRPVSPETGFRLGSMSKAFTALAVMRMVEAGAISLDQRVVEVLPDFALADQSDADAITLRHLLAHTSGIPERAPRAAPDASLREHVEALASVASVAQPGERHIYASPNYLIAARMIEVASGRSFEAVVQDQIMGPLMMHCTHVSAANDEARLLSGGHQYWFGLPIASQLPEDEGRLATASLISCARDMAQFLIFQLGDGVFGGDRLLSAANMATMHDGTVEGDGFRYAMGWRDTTLRNTRAVEHGGILPDYRSKMVLLPDLDAAVVVLTNASASTPLPAHPTSHRLADNIAEYLAGGELKHPTLTFGTVSIAVAIGLGLFVLAAVAELVRVLRGKDRSARPLARAALDVVIILGIATALPMLLGMDWPVIIATMPDMALWMLLLAALSVITSFARVVSRRRS